MVKSQQYERLCSVSAKNLQKPPLRLFETLTRELLEVVSSVKVKTPKLRNSTVQLDALTVVGSGRPDLYACGESRGSSKQERSAKSETKGIYPCQVLFATCDAKKCPDSLPNRVNHPSAKVDKLKMLPLEGLGKYNHFSTAKQDRF